jgi:hypothetical protein
MLRSNQMTADPRLFRLFNYKNYPFAEIVQVLEEFERVTFNDLATYACKTLTILMQLLGSGIHVTRGSAGAEAEGSGGDAGKAVVFNALVNLMARLSDPKVRQFNHLVVQFTDSLACPPPDPELGHPLTSVALLELLQDHLRGFTSSERKHKLKPDLLKVVHLMLAMATALSSSKGNSDGCRMQCLGVFAQIHQLCDSLGDEEEVVDEKKNAQEKLAHAFAKQARALAVKMFPDYLHAAEQLLAGPDLAQVTLTFLACVPTGISKLQLVRRILDGPVGSQPATRALVFPSVVILLGECLFLVEEGHMDEPYLSLGILVQALTRAQHMAMECLPLLEPMLVVVRQFQLSVAGEVGYVKPSQTVQQVAQVDMKHHPLAITLTILREVPEPALVAFLAGLMTARRVKLLSYLLKMCVAASSTLAFPDMWLTMNMFQLSTVLKVLRAVRSVLLAHHAAEAVFDESLFRAFFQLSFQLLFLPLLNLDDLAPAKRDFVLAKYGDLRLPVLAEVQIAYSALGTARLAVLSVVIPELIKLSQSKSFERAAFALYCESTEVEFLHTGKFSQCERHTVDYIYSLTNSSASSAKEGEKPAQMARAFVEALCAHLSAHYALSDELRGPGAAFLAHLQKVNGLVCKFMALNDQGELLEDECTAVALDLMNYLESSGHAREEMQTGYVQYLVDFHAKLGNFVEAGMTQLRQIRLSRWSDDMCISFKNYPREPHRVRKERLLRSAAQFFEQARDYERAIASLQEIGAYHKFQNFNFARVAELCKQEATLWARIGTENRVYANYFRVEFFGADFKELELQGRTFVYRGVTVESVRDFTARLKAKFPRAHVLPRLEVPSKELEEKHPQIISIVLLSLVPLEDRRGLLEEFENTEGTKVPELQEKLGIGEERYDLLTAEVRRHLENNVMLRVFEISKGVQKATEKNPTNEFKTLWVEKTYVFTEESFPTNRRRIPVVWTKVKNITPLENAVMTVKSKNDELRFKLIAVRDTPREQPVDVGPLSMNLNGILDAAVNGGTQKYIDAFLANLPAYEFPISWHALTEVEVHVRPSLHSEVCGIIRRHDRITEMERRGVWLRHAGGWSLRCNKADEFFDSKDSTREVPLPTPERALTTDLKDLLREQLRYCEKGLGVFVERAPENLRPLSVHLRSMLNKTTDKINLIVSA